MGVLTLFDSSTIGEDVSTPSLSSISLSAERMVQSKLTDQNLAFHRSGQVIDVCIARINNTQSGVALEVSFTKLKAAKLRRLIA